MRWENYLTRSDLLQTGLLINGVWLTKGRETFAVSNPANGELLANVSCATAADLDASVLSSHQAFLNWKKLTAKARSKILRRWYELIIANVDDLATILTLEQGKPLAEAKGEILYGAAYLEWYGEEAKRAAGDIIAANNPEQRVLVQSEPIGVCAAITPWNFPNAMLARKVAPALAAGCSMLAKPASATPLSANALACLALEAGVPAGVFNIIHGKSHPIGEFLCHNPQVRKLTFTGSTEVGVWLYQNCASTMKKLSLELGGNAPLIVFEDADLDVAVSGIMQSKFRNSGQTCVCSNRIFVHESIKEELIERLLPQISALKLGFGLDDSSTNGPLIDIHALEHVKDLLTDAIEQGANLVCGGYALPELGELFFAPTLLDCPHTDLRIFNEEIFGPLLALYTFKEDVQVIELANKTAYGLASYIFSRDIGRIFRVSEALEYGMVGVNSGLISAENIPFGGVKMSGLGREGGTLGLQEYLTHKYICLNL
jgi:succinate-semialdehyde dehydrogenase/glutarate-semialdehyde dehydrogenase